FGEPLAVAAEPTERDGLLRTNLEAADALEDIGRPARLAELAVIHDVEPGLDLVEHDFVDGAPQPCVALAGRRLGRLEQGGRANETADVGRQDSVEAAKHALEAREKLSRARDSSRPPRTARAFRALDIVPSNMVVLIILLSVA